jgi:hypothetical protein
MKNLTTPTAILLALALNAAPMLASDIAPGST